MARLVVITAIPVYVIYIMFFTNKSPGMYREALGAVGDALKLLFETVF